MPSAPTTAKQQEAIAQAIAFKATNPEESLRVGARIHGASENTVQSRVQRQHQRKNKALKPRGGQNRILSDSQIKAIVKYTDDMRIHGLGATKSMVFAAIGFLKESEGRPLPSRRWFQHFLHTNPELFRTVKTKPIARNRVSAQDVEDVQAWFDRWRTYSEKNNLTAEDIINFDEGGFQIGVTGGEDILVPAWVTDV
jgi:hypothetical protein